MPIDAKFGLLVGVGLTITVAVVFFSKVPGDSRLPQRVPPLATAASPTVAHEPVVDSASTAAQPASAPPPPPAALRPISSAPEWRPMPRQHVVAAGETLFTIAQRYYGDGARVGDLYQANRAVIANPDRLAVGAKLIIP